MSIMFISLWFHVCRDPRHKTLDPCVDSWRSGSADPRSVTDDPDQEPELNFTNQLEGNLSKH